MPPKSKASVDSASSSSSGRRLRSGRTYSEITPAVPTKRLAQTGVTNTATSDTSSSPVPSDKASSSSTSNKAPSPAASNKASSPLTSSKASSPAASNKASSSSTSSKASSPVIRLPSLSPSPPPLHASASNSSTGGHEPTWTMPSSSDVSPTYALIPDWGDESSLASDDDASDTTNDVLGGFRARSALPVSRYPDANFRLGSSMPASHYARPPHPTYFEYMQNNLAQARYRFAHHTHKGLFYWIMLFVMSTVCALIYQDPAEEYLLDKLLYHGGLSINQLAVFIGSILCYLTICDRTASACLGCAGMAHEFHLNLAAGSGLVHACKACFRGFSRKILEPMMFSISALVIGHYLHPDCDSGNELAAAVFLACILLGALEVVVDATESLLAGKGLRIPLFPLLISIVCALGSTNKISDFLAGRHWKAAQTFGGFGHDQLPMVSSTITDAVGHQESMLEAPSLSLPEIVSTADQESTIDLANENSIVSSETTELTPVRPLSITPCGQPEDAVDAGDTVEEGPSYDDTSQYLAGTKFVTFYETHDASTTSDTMIMQHAREKAHFVQKPTREEEDTSSPTSQMSSPNAMQVKASSLSSLGLLLPFLEHGMFSGFGWRPSPRSSSARSTIRMRQSSVETPVECGDAGFGVTQTGNCPEFLTKPAPAPEPEPAIATITEGPKILTIQPVASPETVLEPPPTTIDLSEKAIIERIRAEFKDRIWVWNDPSQSIRTRMYTGRDKTVTDLVNGALMWTETLPDGDLKTVLMLTPENWTIFTILESTLNNPKDPRCWILWFAQWLFPTPEYPRYAYEDEIYSIKRSEAAAAETAAAAKAASSARKTAKGT